MVKATASRIGVEMYPAVSDSAWAVAVDSGGNVYLTGFTDGNLGGETNSGGTDAFLAKYNASGTLQWTRLLGNATLTYSYAVAVASGNGSSPCRSRTK